MENAVYSPSRNPCRRNLRQVCATRRFRNIRTGWIKNGCPLSLIFVTSITCHMHTATAWFPFSTNYRKRSKPKRNTNRRHKQSRCMTSLFTPAMLALMSLRPQKTVLWRRLPMHRLIGLQQQPTKPQPPGVGLKRGEKGLQMLGYAYSGGATRVGKGAVG